MIHDNGSRPFKVVANNKGIFVYTYQDDPERDIWSDDEPDYDILLMKFTKFIGFWVGKDTSEYTSFNGNSILIQETMTSYVSIGWKIHRFETSEEILDYVSPVGNSDVPYPVAYSENYVYFMLDNQYVEKDQMITEATAFNAEKIYGEFYGIYHKENLKKRKKKKFKKLKLLKKRKY